VLLVVAGVGYQFDSYGTVLSQGAPLMVSTVTFGGEFLLALWLVVWSDRRWPMSHVRRAPAEQASLPVR
jgi:hypothetical protein